MRKDKVSKDAAVALAAQAERKVSQQLLFVDSCYYKSNVFSLFVASAADTTVPLLSPLFCKPVVLG
jgi:hypothetical protein